MEKRRARLILNGKSAGRDDVRRAVKSLREEGYDVSVRVTWEGGDVQRLVSDALVEREEIDVVVAGGGDGTINEVCNAVLRSLEAEDEPPFAIGILLLGTANDFARGISIDPTDIETCLRKAVSGDVRRVDAARFNDRTFMNMATGGFGAQVTAETDPRLKSLFGGAAYLFTGISRFSELVGFEAQISGDDVSWEGEFLALAIGNGRQAGGGVVLCPDARLDDGLLDLTIIPTPRKEQVPEVLDRIVRKGLQEARKDIVTSQARRYLVESSQELQFNLDGEPVRGNRFEISVEPHRLSLIY